MRGLTIILLLFSCAAWGKNTHTKVCEPLVYIKGYRGSTVVMAKSELINTNEIYVKNECEPELVYKITHFECSFSANRGESWKSFNIIGNTFTTELKESLKQVDKGEKKVFFDNITVKFADGSLKKFNGLSLTIR